jgi:hypothetical protein
MADVERLGAGNPDGCLHGDTTAEKIGFYGVSPCISQRGGSFTAITGASDSTAVATLVNEIRSTIVALGLHAAT